MQVQFKDHPTDPDKVILRKRGLEAPMWISLTFDERREICRSWSSPMDAIYATERLLKEKNAGI